MDIQQAKTLLALADDSAPGPAEIDAAYQTQKIKIEAQINDAPTAVLADKFKQRLQSFDEAKALLLAVPEVQISNTSPSALSQTKMADLPGAGPTAQASLQPGQWLAERYEIKHLIAQGGMGAVYQAYDKNRDAVIAIKVLLPELLKNDRAKEKFLDEARLSSELSHPNIVNVFDVQNDGELYFLTMELLEGQDLRGFITSHQNTGQSIEVEEALDIAQSLCEALSYAHASTVHRDIKPENVFMCEDGQIKLMDFGIARIVSNTQRTQTGAATGTAYYMAPEQIKGRGQIDGRADQYALAVLLYELLSGEVPTGRMESLNKIRKDVPKALSLAVDTALSPKAESRFIDITAFATALSKKRSGIKLPFKAMGIAVGVLMGVGLLGGVLMNVDMNSLKDLLPQNQEEIRQQKAQAARIQGEIKTLKNRLEQRRRSLDVDVRAASREGGDKALELAQRLSEQAIFTGGHLVDLEGLLSMAETQIRENTFVETQQTLTQVRDGYQYLLKEFDAAGALYKAEQGIEANQVLWQQLQKKYDLSSPPLLLEVDAAVQQAEGQRRSGELQAALGSYQNADSLWHEAYKEVELQVNKVKATRTAAAGVVAKKAAAARAKRAERQKIAAAKADEIAKKEARRKRILERALPTMVRIPAGTFRMGCVSGRNCYKDEAPIHKVAIKAFKLSEAEITHSQWIACVRAKACKTHPSSQGWGGRSRPVVAVSYKDITEQYIPWLNRETRGGYRLPSEAEWEYAARAGSDTKYSWGNKIDCTQARYGSGVDECGKQKSSDKVKSFSPNRYGLYDMHGNVSEWVEDCRNENYEGAPGTGNAWGNGDCERRMVRGGSWVNKPEVLGSSYRWDNLEIKRYNNVGFRLAQDL